MNVEFERLAAILDRSTCSKRQVAAGGWMEFNDRRPKLWITATNSCERGDCCYRLGSKTGENEHWCKSTHAEIALVNKIKAIKGDCWMETVFVFGHYYACAECSSALYSIGVKEIRIRET